MTCGLGGEAWPAACDSEETSAAMILWSYARRSPSLWHPSEACSGGGHAGNKATSHRANMRTC